MLKLVALRGQALGRGSRTPSIASGKSSTATGPLSTPSISSPAPSTRSSSAADSVSSRAPKPARDAELETLMRGLVCLRRHLPARFAVVNLLLADCLTIPAPRRRRQKSPPRLPFETLFTVAQVVTAAMFG